MSPPAFLDTNIPIYAAGRAHPLKEPCGRVLALTAKHPYAFVADAEVLQELLHRYLALRLWPQGSQILGHFATLLEGQVEPVYAADVKEAASLADGHRELAARDLLHVAVMKRLGVRRIVSADRGFDQLQGIERLDPIDVAAWAEDVVRSG